MLRTVLPAGLWPRASAICELDELFGGWSSNLDFELEVKPEKII